jgi:hypothetical protein
MSEIDLLNIAYCWSWIAPIVVLAIAGLIVLAIAEIICDLLELKQ